MVNRYQQKVFRILSILQLSLAVSIFVIFLVNVAGYREHQFLGTGITIFFLVLAAGILGLLAEYLTFSRHHRFQSWKIVHLFLNVISTTLCGLFFAVLLSSFIDKHIPTLPVFVIQLILFFLEFLLGAASATFPYCLPKSISNGAVICGTATVDL